MAVYEYNSSTINEYSEDSCGLLSTSSDDIFDCGTISNSVSETEDYFSISISETLTPFGTLKVTNKKINAKTKKVSSYSERLYNINKKSIILNGLIINWIGFGTLFELDNGLIRQVIPDVSGGGVI